MLYLLLKFHYHYQVKNNWWSRFVINLFNIGKQESHWWVCWVEWLRSNHDLSQSLMYFEPNKQINRSVVDKLSQSVVAVGVIILKVTIRSVFSKFAAVCLILIVFSVVFMHVKSFAIATSFCSSSTILISLKHIHLQRSLYLLLGLIHNEAKSYKRITWKWTL